MTGHSKWATIKHKTASWSWDDFLNDRMRREDEAVALKFSYYKSLGRGHLRHDLIKGWRDDDSRV